MLTRTLSAAVLRPRGTAAAALPALPAVSAPVAARYVPDPTTCWRDAARTVPCGDGDPICVLDDVSGLGRHLTQPVQANRPQLERRSGEWCVRYDLQQWLELPPVAVGPLTASEIFVQLVNEYDTPTAANNTGIWTLGPAATNLVSHYPFSDGVIYEAFGTTVRKTVGNPSTLLTDRNVYNVASAPGEHTTRLNGTTLFTTATNAVAWASLPVFGRSYDGTTYRYFRGSMGEIVLFAGALSSGDRALMLGYYQRLISGVLGARRVLHDRAFLGATPALGGSGPRALTLYRDGVSLGTVAEDAEWADTGLSPSTAYNYRLDTTDSTGTVSTSYTITTPAASTPPSYTTPTGPNTSYLTGAVPLDVDGNPLECACAGVEYDHVSGLYWLVGNDITTGAWSVRVYYSADKLNWKSAGVVIPTGSATFPGFGAVASGTLERPKIAVHPVTGVWYIFVHVLLSGRTYPEPLGNFTGVWTATRPDGPYTPFALLNYNNLGQNDVGLLKDLDGSAYLYWATSTSQVAYCARLNSDWSGYGRVQRLSNNASGLPPVYEGAAPFRRGGTYHVMGSPLNGWAPAAGFARSGYSPFGPFVIRQGAAVYTTPDSNFSPNTSPFPGTVGGDFPWGSGTNFGIHPAISYNSQSGNVWVTREGEYVLQADRWIGNGSSSSSLVWLPITFDGSGLPTVPYAQTWTPSG